MGPAEFLTRLMFYISFEGYTINRATVASSLLMGVYDLSGTWYLTSNMLTLYFLKLAKAL